MSQAELISKYHACMHEIARLLDHNSLVIPDKAQDISVNYCKFNDAGGDGQRITVSYLDPNAENLLDGTTRIDFVQSDGSRFPGDKDLTKRFEVCITRGWNGLSAAHAKFDERLQRWEKTTCAREFVEMDPRQTEQAVRHVFGAYQVSLPANPVLV